MEMREGGTYAVALNTPSSAYLATDIPFTSGLLYYIDDSGGSPQRQLVSSIFVKAWEASDDVVFGWPAVGQYELDIVQIGPPCCLNLKNDPLHFFVKLFFGDVAYAQFDPPTVVETLHFGIEDANAGCAEDCFSNVLFLPGIEASRLYRPYGGGEKRLWEPGRSADAIELEMNPDGSSMRADIYTRDVLDNAYVPAKGNVYASFIADMNGLKANGTINDWEAAPYDWRLTPDQILESGSQNGSNISYLAATDTPFILQELQRLAHSSKSGKVTLIAHSNGGLVAKALMQKLGSAVTAQLVDKVILVASPQAGTPQALAGLLHGHDQALPFAAFPYALTPSVARQIGDTMPGLYTLIPSASYFTYVNDPVFTFSTSSVADWAGLYGDVIHSGETQHAFLTDTAHRTQPSVDDLSNPTILSDAALTEAESVHDSLDAWTPPDGVRLIQIAGWGVPTTVSGIDYVRTLDDGALTILPNPRFVIDGDGTVVVPSALWVNEATGAKDYWVNLEKYNVDHKFTTLFGHIPFSHANILEIAELRNLVRDLIADVVKPVVDYDYLSTESPSSTLSRLRYALHSPLTLNLYDNLGHHTGISTTTGEIDEDIPGSYYTEFGDIKYIFADGTAPAHIFMDGYGDGAFTFNVDQFEGNSLIASTTFKDVPTTSNTFVNLDIGSDISTLSPMHVDENGDGKTDFTLPVKLGGVATVDTTPPEASVTVSTSTRDFAITGIDDNAPVGVVKGTTSATLTDAAGNSTVLSFQKVSLGKLLNTVKITGIKYGSGAKLALSSSLTYIWDSKQNLISQTVVVDNQTVIQATFDPKKNRSAILILKKGKSAQLFNLNGLALIRLMTNKGIVGYGW
jgi:pimeloyl-ACP methyl ester carboxylesterase